MMKSRGCHLLHQIIILLFCVSLLSIVNATTDVGCGVCLPHTPLFAEDYLLPYNELAFAENTYVFPSEENVDKFPYTYHFFGKLNFDDAPEGTFFVGARNILYEIDMVTLTETKSFNWTPLYSDNATCWNDASDPEIACENYIRLYRKIPFEDSRLLVCGTGAFNVTCKTVDRMNISNIDEHGSPTPKLKNGIISPHPYFPFEGDFLDDLLTYETTGYFAVNNPESFTFARYNVSYDSSSKDILFSNMPTRTGVDGIGFSINNPYYPVKMIKQDLDGTNSFKMNYYFIREKKYYDFSSDAAPVRARFIRVCQDDRGLPNNFYRTFVKMEILCFGEHFQIPQAVGTQEHYYTVLRDVIQGESPSRYYGNRYVWQKMVYMLFTTDVYGPNGTAICVYHAHFKGNTGFTNLNYRGIIDVFSFNEYKDELGIKDGEDNILNCDLANDRTEADHIISYEFVKQYEGLKLPLMESAGDVLTKIAVDQVCVKYDENSTCLFQDVLFVGNHKGTVSKIIMSLVKDSDRAELNGLTHDPIITQQWQLADENSVEQLYVKDGDVYVGTYSRLYKFPVANCSRHMSCYACLASRDPYCYWDLSQSKCLRTSALNVTEHEEYEPWLNDNHLQNIHTGEDSKCNVTPICSLTITAEESDTIMIEGLGNCNYTNSFDVTIEPYEKCEAETITHSLTNSDSSVSDEAILGRRLYNVIVTAYGDNGNSSFSKRIMTPNGGPVAPTDSEVIAGAINSSFVQVVVILDGCNLHDELEKHMICVEFNSEPEICQNYSGVNTFVSGPYNGSESVSYTVTTKNSYGEESADVSSVSTFALPPKPPKSVAIRNSTVSSVSLEWIPNPMGNNDLIGYSIYVNGVKRTDCSTQGTVYTLHGLYSYTDYSFSITSCSIGGESDFVQVNVTTECQRPTQVRNLRVSDLTSVDMTFEWDKPIYNNGSNLMYKVTERCYNRSSLGIEENTETVMEPMYKITDLSPLTQCCAAVMAVSTCVGVEYLSESELACDISLDGIPGPVEQLTIIPNPDSLLVTWLPPINYTNPSLRYDVSWISENTNLTSDMTLDQLFWYIKDLNQSENYTVNVKAMSLVDYGPVVSANSFTLPDIPSAPHDVSITFTNCSMSVSWSHNDKDDYDVTMYRVRAHCNDRNYSKSVAANQQSATIDSVCENGSQTLAWCTAQVQALNAIGYGEYSPLADEVFPFRSLPTPMCFKSIDSTATNVFISYTIPSPYALDDLMVMYEVDPEPDSTAPPSGDQFNGNNTIVLSGLKRDTMYDFKLYLCTSDNECSGFCDILGFTPPQEPPHPPTNIILSDISSSEFTLTWTHPENENPSNLNYIVDVTSNGGSYVDDTGNGVNSMTISDLLPDTYYYCVIRSNYVVSNITGRYSESIRVLTNSSLPQAPMIVNVQFLNISNRLNTTNKLSVSWEVAHPPNGTVSDFQVAWATIPSNRSQIDCDRAYDSSGVDVPGGPSKRYYEKGNLVNTLLSSVGGYVCVRSKNLVGVSDWVYKSFNATENLISLTSEAVSSNTDDIGILSGAVLFAVLAIVLAIVLVILIVYCIATKGNKSSAQNSPANHRSELPDLNNIDYADVKEDMNNGSHKSGKKRNPATRAESTRSTTSRTVMLKQTSESVDSEEKQTCCNFV